MIAYQAILTVGSVKSARGAGNISFTQSPIKCYPPIT